MTMNKSPHVRVLDRFSGKTGNYGATANQERSVHHREKDVEKPSQGLYLYEQVRKARMVTHWIQGKSTVVRQYPSVL